jgi:hypothetical protein
MATKKKQKLSAKMVVQNRLSKMEDLIRQMAEQHVIVEQSGEWNERIEREFRYLRREVRSALRELNGLPTWSDSDSDSCSASASASASAE